MQAADLLIMMKKQAILCLLLSFSAGNAQGAVDDQSVFVEPGDAAWLGDYGTGDGTPPIEDYLPFPYTLLGSDGDVLARVMVDLNETCPTLVADDEIDLESFPEVMERAAGDFTLPDAFPVRLCEVRLQLPADKLLWSESKVRFAGVDQNVRLTSNPKKYLLMGDSGLRVKPKDLGLGKCKSSGYELYGIPQCDENFTQADLNSSEVSGDYQSLSDWPLQVLQSKAAAEEPDVVVYVGDYLYRQGPCPEASGADCVAINGPPTFTTSDLDGTVANFLPSMWGDNLYGWWADFFYPSMALLHTSPMIAIRGNHESCNRAGPGYFFFLAVQEPPNGTDFKNWCVNYSDPFAVPFENEQWLVMDNGAIDPMNGGIDDMNFTPGACPEPPADGSTIVPQLTNRHWDSSQSDESIAQQIAIYAGQWEYLAGKAATHKTNFFAAHRPVFAVACNSSFLATEDWTMQQSLSATTLDRVSAIVSGHMHWLEVLAYENEALPTQIVVGNGGTEMIPNYINQSVWPYVEIQAGGVYTGRVRKGLSSSSNFGFCLLERDGNGDYDLTCKNLDTTSGDLVDVDFDVTIPQGPRVGDDTPTSAGCTTYTISLGVCLLLVLVSCVL